MTIAQTVSELHNFFEIQDGGVRHVGSHEKSIFHISYWQCFMRPIFTSNLVTIAQTVSKLQPFFEIQDGGVRHVGFHKKSFFHILHW